MRRLEEIVKEAKLILIEVVEESRNGRVVKARSAEDATDMG